MSRPSLFKLGYALSLSALMVSAAACQGSEANASNDEASDSLNVADLNIVAKSDSGLPYYVEGTFGAVKPLAQGLAIGGLDLDLGGALAKVAAIFKADPTSLVFENITKNEVKSALSNQIAKGVSDAMKMVHILNTFESIACLS